MAQDRAENIELFEVEADDLWIRDTGPVFTVAHMELTEACFFPPGAHPRPSNYPLISPTHHQLESIRPISLKYHLLESISPLTSPKYHQLQSIRPFLEVPWGVQSWVAGTSGMGYCRDLGRIANSLAACA